MAMLTIAAVGYCMSGPRAAGRRPPPRAGPALAAATTAMSVRRWVAATQHTAEEPVTLEGLLAPGSGEAELQQHLHVVGRVRSNQQRCHR